MKRYKLTKAISKFDSFLNEKENVEVTAEVAEAPAEVATDTSREAMIADVDTIINSLETLAGQVAEMLEELETQEINEKSSLVVQWAKLKTGLGAKQKKINQMKLKSSDMAMAASQLQGRDNADKKAYLKDKKANLDQQIKSIQALVNDRADELGTLASRGVNKLRLAGEIEVVKSQIGSLDKTEAGEMKKRLKDLIDQERKEADAVKDLAAKADADAQDEKGDDKVNAMKEVLADLKAKKANDMQGADKNDPQVKLKGLEYDLKIQDLQSKIDAEDGNTDTDPGEHVKKAKEIEAEITKLKAEIEAAAKNSEEGGNDEEPAASNEPAASEPAEKPVKKDTKGEVGKSGGESDLSDEEREAKNSKQGKLDRLEKMIKDEQEKLTNANPESKKIQDEIERLEGELAKANPNPKDKKAKDGLEILKQTIEDRKEKLALARSKNSSPRLDKLKKLKKDILTKESWQLEGTELGRLLEMEISKLENEMILNESRYYNSSIKDAFSRLI